MWVYRRTFDAATGEYRRGEYVGYVWSPVPQVGTGAYGLRPTTPPPEIRRRSYLVRLWEDWRAWRRARSVGHVDLGLEHVEIEFRG